MKNKDTIFQSIDDITGPVCCDRHDLKYFIYPSHKSKSANYNIKKSSLTSEDLTYIINFLDEELDV